MHVALRPVSSRRHVRVCDGGVSLFLASTGQLTLTMRVSSKRKKEVLDAPPENLAWYSRADEYGEQGVLEAVGFPTATVEEVNTKCRTQL